MTRGGRRRVVQTLPAHWLLLPRRRYRVEALNYCILLPREILDRVLQLWKLSLLHRQALQYGVNSTGLQLLGCFSLRTQPRQRLLCGREPSVLFGHICLQLRDLLLGLGPTLKNFKFGISQFLLYGLDLVRPMQFEIQQCNFHGLRDGLRHLRKYC